MKVSTPSHSATESPSTKSQPSTTSSPLQKRKSSPLSTPSLKQTPSSTSTKTVSPFKKSFSTPDSTFINNIDNSTPSSKPETGLDFTDDINNNSRHERKSPSRPEIPPLSEKLSKLGLQSLARKPSRPKLLSSSPSPGRSQSPNPFESNSNNNSFNSGVTGSGFGNKSSRSGSNNFGSNRNFFSPGKLESPFLDLDQSNISASRKNSQSDLSIGFEKKKLGSSNSGAEGKSSHANSLSSSGTTSSLSLQEVPESESPSIHKDDEKSTVEILPNEEKEKGDSETIKNLDVDVTDNDRTPDTGDSGTAEKDVLDPVNLGKDVNLLEGCVSHSSAAGKEDATNEGTNKDIASDKGTVEGVTVDKAIEKDDIKLKTNVKVPIKMS
ncbi:unnamed protein product [Ambrosiozyma monospora]|uniref:Unnamed protein product n=1 Tax=Ambrosiozyma monospora TaxID=43982 RepID=A0ACB5TLH7_AMBMO|nr:unnamed protein product [Ambrosiozyma monospora]